MSSSHETAITLSLNDQREVFCVYSHTLPAQPDVVFYVGLCKLHRVFWADDAWRNSYYKQHITLDMYVTLKIIFTSASLTECLDKQSMARAVWQPTANVRGFITSGKGVVHNVVTGAIYDTAAQAAQLNGVTSGAMANHLNGRAGYATIRGNRFKRGLPPTTEQG